MTKPSKLIADLGKYLTDKQIGMVAETYRLKPAHVKAIIAVETGGSGFFDAGGVYPTLVPKVRFENHKFGKHTKGKYHISHPHLSSARFDGKYNKVGIAEYMRFEEAYALDGEAAVYSTSWGLGQVLGENWKDCHYPTLKSFLDDAFESEYTQLTMMFYFMEHHHAPLLEYVRTERWGKYAEFFNGKNYRQNQYDIKLSREFKKYNV